MTAPCHAYIWQMILQKRNLAFLQAECLHSRPVELTVNLPSIDAVGWVAGKASGLWKTEWWGAGVVICLEWGADLHMAQLMPLPLTVSCFSKIQIAFTFLALAHLGSPGQRAVKPGVCVCAFNFRSQFSFRPQRRLRRRLLRSSSSSHLVRGRFQFAAAARGRHSFICRAKLVDGHSSRVTWAGRPHCRVLHSSAERAECVWVRRITRVATGGGRRCTGCAAEGRHGLAGKDSCIQTLMSIQYNTKFVKRHVAVAPEVLANRTVKKHRRRRTNVLYV